MVSGTIEVRNKFLTYFFVFWDPEGRVKSYHFLLFKLSTTSSNSCSTFPFSLATFLKLFLITRRVAISAFVSSVASWQSPALLFKVEIVASTSLISLLTLLIFLSVTSGFPCLSLEPCLFFFDSREMRYILNRQ